MRREIFEPDKVIRRKLFYFALRYGLRFIGFITRKMSVQKHEIEIIFLTLFKIMPASGNSNKEGDLTVAQTVYLFFFLILQSRMLFQRGSKCVLNLVCHDLSF